MSRKSSKIAKNIRYLREELGLTQLELAERANLDVTTINRIENLSSEPTLSSLGKIAKALKTNVNELLTN